VVGAKWMLGNSECVAVRVVSAGGHDVKLREIPVSTFKKMRSCAVHEPSISASRSIRTRFVDLVWVPGVFGIVGNCHPDFMVMGPPQIMTGG
jgi:hypothetical protein